MCEMIDAHTYWTRRNDVPPLTHYPTRPTEDSTQDRIATLEVMVAKLNATVVGLTESLKVADSEPAKVEEVE